MSIYLNDLTCFRELNTKLPIDFNNFNQIMKKESDTIFFLVSQYAI